MPLWCGQFPPKVSQKTHHSSPVRARYGVSFVDSFSDLYSAPVTAVMYAISYHDFKWKLFPRYWPFVQGIHRSSVNSPHKGQWCRALMFSLICTRTNNWANDGDASDLRRHRAHYGVTVMEKRVNNWLYGIIYSYHFLKMWKKILRKHCIFQNIFFAPMIYTTLDT